MPAQASGWAKLGDALGGNSELEYEKGLNLGANTENALSMASERRSKAKAQSEAEEAFVALGTPRAQAHAMSVAQQAGGSFKDVGDYLAKDQERGFRNDAAGLTGLDVATGNRRLMGVANGPVDRFQKVGNGFDDRFDEAGVQPLPGGARDGGGAAGAIQIMESFGMLDDTGHVRPGMEERAFDIMRSTQSNVQVGDVPHTVNANPFHNAGHAPAAAPAAGVDTVAGNLGEVERQKAVGKGAGEAAVALPDQLADIDSMRKAITGFVASPGFKGAYGNLQGQPGVKTLMGLADGDVQDAQVRLGNLSAKAFGVSIQKMRGLGNLSNAEGQKMEDAYTVAIDPRSSEAMAAQAWNDVLDSLDLNEIRAKRKAQVSTKPGGVDGTQFTPAPGAQPPPSGAPPAGVPVTPTAPATTPATPATPRSFASEAEAAAAGLPDGAKIIVNGRPATWMN